MFVYVSSYTALFFQTLANPIMCYILTIITYYSPWGEKFSSPYSSLLNQVSNFSKTKSHLKRVGSGSFRSSSDFSVYTGYISVIKCLFVLLYRSVEGKYCVSIYLIKARHRTRFLATRSGCIYLIKARHRPKVFGFLATRSCLIKARHGPRVPSSRCVHIKERHNTPISIFITSAPSPNQVCGIYCHNLLASK